MAHETSAADASVIVRTTAEADRPPAEADCTPAEADRLLAVHAARWWRDGDSASIESACRAVPAEALPQWPDLARWRALAAQRHEQSDALACLECAHAGHQAQGDALAALVDAHLALLLCLLDIGAMDQLSTWQAHASRGVPVALVLPLDVDRSLDALWLRLGLVARAALGHESPPGVDAAVQWLQAQFRPLQQGLSPDEKVMAAQALINLHFARQQYEQLDWLATQVQRPAEFERAAPVTRARWLYTLGFGHYQIGQAERAEAEWQQALALATAHGLVHSQLMLSLAMLRLLLDRGRLAEARQIEAAIQPNAGAGRITQLIELQQMRARLLLLGDQPARAQASLQEALALAEQGGLSAAERASCLTDLAQVLIARSNEAEAAALLAQLVAEHRGRDAQVYQCLLDLLQAWRQRDSNEAASQRHLASGLQRAQQARYTMFFRLLPRLAAQLCALALRWQIEPGFVGELIRARGLAAPAEADERWPWALWLQLLGGFELRLNGQWLQRSGKPQQKPLELLRALACERSLAASADALADALWPDADGAAARKSLEMAVQRLRRLLGDDSLVRVGDGRIALDAARISADLLQRRRLIERLEGLAMQPAADAPAAAALAEGASLAARIVALSAGALLPGAPEAVWLAAQRQRCDRDAARALRAATALADRAGDEGQRALLVSALQALRAQTALD